LPTTSTSTKANDDEQRDASVPHASVPGLSEALE